MPLRSMVLFLFVLFSGAAQAATILVWGDSLSAGYGLRSEEAWPTLLQTRLTREGFPHQVVNGSVSGETSAGGRSRLPAALEHHRPEVVILELGGNDGLRGLPPAQLADNLGAMVDAAQAAGARVLVVGMQMPPNYGPAYTRRFAATFGEVAGARGAALLPFLLEGFAERRELFQADGIHPTAEAQPLIVDNVWPHLVPLLDKAGR
ncbi:arylesterase [Pseudothauera nasutitermitis]|uniref:Arylesterase n=1 Tax=Pseudothauera nasutitermitis TaxID=2565930 RepID=A0A4V3WCK0_9RHOO|nr:arylesterase [Pseudothauera nasutitermitis]THF67444.1 arylesterase [Pseudothauera nasutitermitis]